MKKQILILVLFLVILSGIGIVSAETLTGTISNSGSYLSKSYNVTQGGGFYYAPDHAYVSAIEYAQGTKAFILFDLDGAAHFDASAPSGATTSFNMTIGGSIIATGTMGYQRYFYINGTENVGYQWWQFDTWNITGLTGNKNILINYNHNALYNVTHYRWNGASARPNGEMLISDTAVPNNFAGGYYLLNSMDEISHTYTATKPDGIGIKGVVNKTEYSSQTFICDGITGATISSDSTINNLNLPFNVVNPTIKIAVHTAAGNWYNTSTLFTGTVTPTPTPTTTPDPYAPIPAGYVRSMFQCSDGATSGHISGANISIKDESTGTWSNVTGRFDGTWYIDTLPGATVSGYGVAAGYTSTSRLNLPASGSVMYELIMQPGNVPAAPTGKVKLFVLVNDYDTGKGIDQAQITVNMYMDSTILGRSNPAGSTSFNVKNATAFYVTVDKPGYDSATRSGTTTDAGPDTVRVELRKTTITAGPTGTPVNGEPTARPTIDARTTGEKDSAMMDQIRDAGPALISLAILMTMIYMVGGGGRK